MVTVKKATYYAVRVGRKTGIFNDWNKAKLQIQGYSKPDYKKFSSLEEAEKYLHFRDKNSEIIYYKEVDNNITKWLPKDLPSIFRTQPYSLWIYCDGSCKNNSDVANSNVSKDGNSLNNSNQAGYGVVILKCKDMSDNPDQIGNATPPEVIQTLHGRVEVNISSDNYMGASHGSNNTGELTAIGEALKWLNNMYTGGLSPVESASLGNTVDLASLKHYPVIINCDSLYAANSVLGIFNGEKNKKLIQYIRNLYKTTKELASNNIYNVQSQSQSHGAMDTKPGVVYSPLVQSDEKENPVVFAHVKGHSGHVWNDLADQLADSGSQM